MAELIGRSGWTTAANGRTNRMLVVADLDGITAHYPGATGTFVGLSVDAIKRHLVAWRNQHIAQGWRDIGYNFLIDWEGRIWEGCGWAQGAHAGSIAGNRTTLGVQLIVGIDEQPTSAQVDAFNWFRHQQLLARNRYATWVGPHSHWTATACPGNQIRDLINSGALLGTPATPTIPDLLMEDDMPLIIAQRQNSQLAKGLYDPATGKIRREISKAENNLLRSAQKESRDQVLYATISDADYNALKG